MVGDGSGKSRGTGLAGAVPGARASWPGPPRPPAPAAVASRSGGTSTAPPGAASPPAGRVPSRPRPRAGPTACTPRGSVGAQPSPAPPDPAGRSPQPPWSPAAPPLGASSPPAVLLAFRSAVPSRLMRSSLRSSPPALPSVIPGGLSVSRDRGTKGDRAIESAVSSHDPGGADAALDLPGHHQLCR